MALQHVRSSPTSRVGAAAHPYGGFFHTAESSHGVGYYHPGCTPACYFYGGPLSTHSSLSDHGGATFLPGKSPSLSTEVVFFLFALVSFPVHLHLLPQALFF